MHFFPKNRKTRISVRLLLLLMGLVLTFLISVPYVYTGFFQEEEIDTRDLAGWEYTEKGLIKGALEFELPGNRGNCWMLIHGYAATPKEMRELGERINQELGDYVYAPRLKGHGEVPSHLLGLGLEDWYEQVEEDFEDLSKECGSLNIVGSSFGAVLALRLAEEKRVKILCLLDPFFRHTHRWYWGFPLEYGVKYLGDLVHYVKKESTGNINSEKGRREHVAYWNMPLGPVKRSYPFLEKVIRDAHKVDEPVLLIHSSKDDVADPSAAREVFMHFSSQDKEFKLLERSNHVLLMDYDKETVIESILEFSREHR